MKQRRNLTLLAFAMSTLFIMAGFIPDVGREPEEREDFSYDSHPVWKATDRAENNLEPEYWGIFTFAAGKGEANALDIEVLRELTVRHDWVMEDDGLTAYFDNTFNWQVRRNTTTGPWSIAETVRDIMDRQSPLAYPEAHGGINWTGPDFDNATQADVDVLLNRLLDITRSDGAFSYRSIISPDLCVVSANGQCRRPENEGTGRSISMYADVGESWRANGFYIQTTVNSTRFFTDYTKTAGEDNYFEYYEQDLDEYYAPSLGVHQSIETYSLSALGLEIEDEIESTGPLVLVSFILMLTVLAFFFRNLRDVMVSALGLGLLILWIFGTAAWLGFPQTQLSSMLPILLLALGVDFVIHSLRRWRKQTLHSSDFGSDPEQASLNAAWESIHSLFPALGVATLTTIIAFGTATLSNIPDLREWGILAAINIFQAYLIMGIFIPILRSGWAPKPANEPNNKTNNKAGSLEPPSESGSILVKLAEFQHAHTLPVLLLFILITLLLSPIILGNPSSEFDVSDYVDNDSRFIRSFNIFKETFPESGEPGYFLIEGDSLQDPQIMGPIFELERELDERKLAPSYVPSLILAIQAQIDLTHQGGPGFNVSNSGMDATGLPVDPTDLVRILNDIQANGTRNHLDPFQATYTFEAGEARELFQIENGNLIRLRVWFGVEDAGNWDYMEGLLEDLEDLQKPLNAKPGVAIQVAGPSFTRYVYVNEITDNFQTSLLIAIGASFLILLFVLRNIRLSIIAILPIAAITIWLRGGMVLTGTSINLVTVQISSLAIGLGIDYTIHVVQRVREARRLNPEAGQLSWMKDTMDETGSALSASAATDFLGFMVLTLSAMPLFFMFGLIMGLMIVLSLVSAIGLLPPLLMRFGRLEEGARVWADRKNKNDGIANQNKKREPNRDDIDSPELDHADGEQVRPEIKEQMPEIKDDGLQDDAKPEIDSITVEPRLPVPARLIFNKDPDE